MAWLLYALVSHQQPHGTVMRAGDFLDTIGVNTHIGSDPYNDPARITAALAYLGVDKIRQSSPIDAGSLATMQAVGRAGAKIDLIINGGGPVDLPGAMASVKQLAPYLNAVEGVNEAAIWPIKYKGLDGVDAAVALQKDLYAAVKADPALAKASVYIFTLGGVDPGAFPSIGDLSAYTDFANIHSYPPHGLRPIFVIHAAIDGGRTNAPSKPVVITETGFYTLPQNAGWGGVPESMQASYIVSLLLDEAAAGVARTYLYDLIDDGPDPQGVNREDHFGLFRFDSTPKIAATALHNLTALLADNKADSHTFPLDGFSFKASGVPYDYTGNTMQFQKSDGTHIVAVWNEQQLWDPDTQVATPVRHFPVTVDLDKTYATVLVYDPIAGADPIQTLHDVSKVSLDLTDHPLMVVVPPPPAVVQAPFPPAPVALDTLVLHVSEDAWGGDAQFVLTVDGQQQGGVRTATASHAAGQSQAVTLTGTFASGAHTLGMTFLNDAWGGTPETDRNLYLDGIDLNGRPLAGSAVMLASNGTWNSGVLSGSATAQPGSGTVVLRVSEDAWRGDAQFVVTVDGRQQGGVRTATALHGLGQSQVVTLSEALTSGSHAIGVEFRNDAWGGTPATDRNLFVDGIELDGQRLSGSNTALFSAGSWSYAVQVG